MGTQTLTEKPSEGTGKRGSQSISQGERPREEPTCQHLDLGLPSLQNCEKMYFCCLSPQAKILGFGSPSKLTQHVCLRACAHVKRCPESRQRTTRDNQRALLLQESPDALSRHRLQASPPGTQQHLGFSLQTEWSLRRFCSFTSLRSGSICLYISGGGMAQR